MELLEEYFRIKFLLVGFSLEEVSELLSGKE